MRVIEYLDNLVNSPAPAVLPKPQVAPTKPATEPVRRPNRYPNPFRRKVPNPAHQPAPEKARDKRRFEPTAIESMVKELTDCAIAEVGQPRIKCAACGQQEVVKYDNGDYMCKACRKVTRSASHTGKQ